MYVQELYADYSENKNYFAKTTKKKKMNGGALPSLLNMATHHTGRCLKPNLSLSFRVRDGCNPTQQTNTNLSEAGQARCSVKKACATSMPSQRRDSSKSRVMYIVMAQRHDR